MPKVGVTEEERSLRVLHLVRSDAFSGVERYLTYVAPELAARGVEVTVVGGDPAWMAPALDPAGVAHRPATTTADVVRAAWSLRRPDLVHTHMTAAEAAAVALKARMRRPLVTTLHFAGVRGGGGAKAAAYRVALRPWIRREVAISQFVADQAGGGAEVIANGVPWTPLEPAPDRGPVVLVAQRLEPEKDTGTALRAWAASALGDRGWELHVAGRGRQRAELDRLARDLGVAGSVRFLGMVDDLPVRMATASVFLAPAPAEPFGLSVVEAMAAGLPVVAAAGGGHLEVLGDGDGQRFPVGDAAAAAAALDGLVADAAMRARLAAANRERWRTHYTVERHVDRLVELYQEVVPGGRSSDHGG